MTFDKGGWGVSQFQICYDKEGKEGSDFDWHGGEGGEFWTPPFLADIICEQPLYLILLYVSYIIAYY